MNNTQESENYLRKLHNEELTILKYVTHVCDLLNINYILYAGTLLGAVRHKGFIPWDDDIDIAMPREDYEIFLSKAPKLLPEHLFVQHYTTDAINIPYIKVRNKNTLFLEADNKSQHICHGIFIDVFPFDRINNNKVRYRVELFKLKLFTKISSCYYQDYINSICTSYKKVIAKFIHYSICKLIPLTSLMRFEDNRRKRRNSKSEDYYMIHAFDDKGLISYNDFFARSKYEFEECIFWGSLNYDLHLKKMYGDYMIVPPKEKQITHKPLQVKFELLG